MDAAHHAFQAILNLFDDPQHVKDIAKLIFKRVLEIVPSHEDYKVLAAACLYRAHCDLKMRPRFREFKRITGISKMTIYTSYQIVNKVLVLWHHKDFMEDFCNALDLSPVVQATAVETYMEAIYRKLKFITDFDANAIAAAIVFKTSQFSESPKTMLEIEEAASVREGDILEAYERILLLPNYM